MKFVSTNVVKMLDPEKGQVETAWQYIKQLGWTGISVDGNVFFGFSSDLMYTHQNHKWWSTCGRRRSALKQKESL